MWRLCCAVLSRSVVSDSWDPMDCSPPDPLPMGILQARILEWVAMPSLQGIIPTQGLNPGLPHCRRILYRLSSQGRLLAIIGLPWWLSGKESTCQHRRRTFNPWVRKIPWRRAWQPTPGFLPGESHGQRSLAGYSPWAHKEWDTTERLSTAQHSLHISL